LTPVTKLTTDLILFNVSGECIFDIPSNHLTINENIIQGECLIPGSFLNDGAYYFSLYFVEDTSTELFAYKECLSFEIADYRDDTNWYGKWWGSVRPNFPITLTPATSLSAAAE
jgi:lipopolysaccharide transport system ATP-binding protein